MLKRRLTEPFGKAGVAIGVIALVFAMLGGAYAATGGNGGKQVATASKKKKKAHKKSNAGLNGTQKKEVKKIARKYAGKPGPNGAAGVAGPAGAKGDPGSAGTDGTNGTNGKSVKITEPALGCQEGGVIVEVEGSGTPHELCNGEEGPSGQTGFTSTLPSGKTETGAWAVYISAAIGYQATGISFAIPLENDLGASKVHFFTDEHFADFCTGSMADPTAPAGELCVYGQGEHLATLPERILKPSSPDSTPEAGADTAGAKLLLPFTEANGRGEGTWAVTAP